jgi:hypothetical protein
MNHPGRKLFATALAIAGLFALVGCEGSMTPGKMEWVQSDSDKPHAGNAYLLRGWIGLFSHGIDNLTDQINEQGVRAHVYQDDQYRTLGDTLVAKYKGVKNPEPLCLIGHSYGADDVVRVARQLDEAGITVDLLVTMDPVTPPELPKNVKLCYNFYQPSMWDATPVLRGIALTQEAGSTGMLHNLNIRAERKDLLEANTNHINIEKNQKIHKVVLEQVLATCPPRQVWTSSRINQPTTQPVQATAARQVSTIDPHGGAIVAGPKASQTGP